MKVEGVDHPLQHILGALGALCEKGEKKSQEKALKWATSSVCVINDRTVGTGQTHIENSAM